MSGQVLLPAEWKKKDKRKRTNADHNPTHKRSKATANRIAEAGALTPLDVMLDNMAFFHGAALKLTEHLVNKLNDEGEMTDQVKDVLEELHISDDPANLFVAAMRFRKSAQACAVDAAPYLHPKLASVTHTGDREKPIVVQVRRVIVDPKNKMIEGKGK